MAHSPKTRTITRLGVLATSTALVLAACSGTSGGEGERAEGHVPSNTGTPDDVMEAPMLTELVEAGELPPLEERLPENPMVMEPIHSEGQYGGTLRRAQADAGNRNITDSFQNAGLIEWNWDADTPIASLAEEFEVSDDNREYTFKLREGLKWSDGEPFTAEDLMFTFEDWLGNETTMPFAPFWFSDGEGKTPATEI